MRWSSQFATRRSLIGYLSGTIAPFLLAVAACSSGQAQQGGSLADAARQARAQKQGQTTPASGQAQQIADELSEGQNDGDAPGGFKTYNAGAYKLWVPAPYMISGHDDGGTVLTGPQTASARPLVLAGTPFALHFNNDDAFREAAIRFVRLYAPSASCTQITLSNRAAYQCGLAGANLLGLPVSGNAVFFRNSDSIFPVFCVASTDSRARDAFNDPNSSLQRKRAARQVLEQQDQDMRNAWRKCDTVFQSIRVAESTPPPVAHQVHQAPAQTQSAPPPSVSNAEEKSVPEGFKAQPFNYCRRQFDCWNASVVVPTNAQMVSSDCKQYVFEMKVQGLPFLLLAGPAGGEGCGDRSASDPSQVRWNELAAPESRRAPGTFHLISSQQATLDGKPAMIYQIGFRKGLTEWMGKRAEIESNGVPLVVGCLAPREHFADGDTICSGLIGSLQLP